MQVLGRGLTFNKAIFLTPDENRPPRLDGLRRRGPRVFPQWEESFFLHLLLPPKLRQFSFCGSLDSSPRFPLSCEGEMIISLPEKLILLPPVSSSPLASDCCVRSSPLVSRAGQRSAFGPESGRKFGSFFLFLRKDLFWSRLLSVDECQLGSFSSLLLPKGLREVPPSQSSFFSLRRRTLSERSCGPRTSDRAPFFSFGSSVIFRTLPFLLFFPQASFPFFCHVPLTRGLSSHRLAAFSFMPVIGNEVTGLFFFALLSYLLSPPSSLAPWLDIICFRALPLVPMT